MATARANRVRRLAAVIGEHVRLDPLAASDVDGLAAAAAGEWVSYTVNPEAKLLLGDAGRLLARHLRVLDPGDGVARRPGRPEDAVGEPGGWTENGQMTPPAPLYDRVGGHETFVRLVSEFYRGVAADPQLRALYPEADLAPAEERLRLFLEQYWGGPHTYSETRGHPRLRIRHAPFAVTPDMRDRWLRHMTAALDSIDLSEPERSEFREYITRAASFMVNSFG